MVDDAPIILVDGSSYFFRAYHALPPLKNAEGFPTQAIYGVANMVRRLQKDFNPHYLAVIFDAKGKTFRDEWYPEYKAHRPPMPEELSCQFEPLVEFLKAMGLPVFIVPGVEADDVIGTLAVQAKAADRTMLISTGDKDMAQLVNDHITLINTMNNHTLDTAGVMTKFGIRPDQMIDYLTLVGDPSDNVPGVSQCGPKTAVKWLTTYETLAQLIENAVEIKGKIGESLRASIPNLSLSKKLVTIRTNVMLDFSLDDLRMNPPATDTLQVLARQWSFKHWIQDESNVDKNPQSNLIETDAVIQYELITTETQLLQLREKLLRCQMFCLDTETTSIKAMEADLVGIGIAISVDKPLYIPLAHQDGTVQLDVEQVLAALRPILENAAIGKIGQNLKYDYLVLKRYGITLKGIVADTMLTSYILASHRNRHDLDSLAKWYLSYDTITFESLAGKGVKQLRFDEIPVEKAAPYAAEDVQVTLQLYQVLTPQLSTEQASVLNTIEVPLLSVLAEMEHHGVLIDEGVLFHQGEVLKRRISLLEQEAFTLANREFNLNSPKQLQALLYDELKLPVLAKTPGGQASTAEPVLQELAYEYRLPALILEYRSLVKLVSTYIDALPKRINPETGRVHTSYNQAVAATGRLSSSEPNLQNIPVRTEEGRMIRQAFIAPPGHQLITADYSQIELRIMAHLSADPTLLKAFSAGLDIHIATASEMFNVPLEAVSREERRRAKAVNFGLIYGMSAFGLAKQLEVSRQEAQSYMDRYFERYPGVFAYMEGTRKTAREQGYVETLFGRRLYLPDIKAREMNRQKAAERAAINAPMQGTAADIIKKAMLDITAWQRTTNDSLFTMVMQVHDELVFEVPDAVIEEAKTIIQQRMERAVTLTVPLLVSVGVGLNWETAH